MAISPCRALGTQHPASAKTALRGGVGSVGPTHDPRSPRLLTLAPKPSPRPHLSGAQQTISGSLGQLCLWLRRGWPLLQSLEGPSPESTTPRARLAGPPGAPANGSRCAAGNVAGRRAGVGANDPPPPPAAPSGGRRAHTGSSRYSLRPSQTPAFNLRQAGAPCGLSRASAPAPRPVPYINV